MKSGDNVFDAALKQAGAIRARGMDEFFDLAKAFEFLQPVNGNRVALSIFSGGEGVLTVDACQDAGLELADLSAETRKKLIPVSPPWGEIPANPFDHGVSFQFHDFNQSWDILLNALADDPNIDCLAIQSWAMTKEIGRNNVKVFREVMKKGKPMVSWLADPLSSKEMAGEIEKLGVPFFPSAERTVKALGTVAHYYMNRQS